MFIMSLTSKRNSISMDTKTLLGHLNRRFHFPSFLNEVQHNAIVEILKRKSDVFVDLATGNGRSLCYLLPAIICAPKVTIVICSLVERVNKQMNNLKLLKIGCAFVTSSSCESEHEGILCDFIFKRGCIRFLFVTPDQVSTDFFKKAVMFLVKKNKLAYIVVDEAHCEGQWFYVSRKGYNPLGVLRKTYLEVPWIVLTALTNVHITNTIKSTLCLKTSSFYKFTLPYLRSNLYYDVIENDDLGNSIDHLYSFVEHSLLKDRVNGLKPQPRGIIFCRTGNSADDVVLKLRAKGVAITALHCRLDKSEMNLALESFSKGHNQIIAATGCFGTGLNILSINFVVHWGLPSNLLDYYVEVSQCGRDSKLANCRIYVSNPLKSYYSLKEAEDAEAEYNPVDDLEKLRRHNISQKILQESLQILEFCKTEKCRQLIIAEYFGDSISPCVDKCDNCVKQLVGPKSGPTRSHSSIKHIAIERDVIQQNIAPSTTNIKTPPTEQKITKN